MRLFDMTLLGGYAAFYLGTYMGVGVQGPSTVIGEWLPAVRDLGGWAVVVWVVWQLMTRWERQMASVVGSLKEMTAALGALDVKQAERYSAAMKVLEQNSEHLRALRQQD